MCVLDTSTVFVLVGVIYREKTFKSFIISPQVLCHGAGASGEQDPGRWQPSRTAETRGEHIGRLCVLDSLFSFLDYREKTFKSNLSLSVHKSYVMVQEPQENKTPDGGSRQEPQKPEENILGDHAYWINVVESMSSVFLQETLAVAQTFQEMKACCFADVALVLPHEHQCFLVQIVYCSAGVQIMSFVLVSKS